MEKATITEVDSLGEDLEHTNFVSPILDTNIDRDHEKVYFRLSKERLIQITAKNIKILEGFNGSDDEIRSFFE